MTWSEAEIERRLPVWSVLSDLFADTSYDDEHYDRMAMRLAASGFDKSEIEAILKEEVAPAFAFNLLDVAGNWTGWPVEHVRKIVLLSQRTGIGAKMKRLAMRSVAKNLIETEWPKLAVRLGN